MFDDIIPYGGKIVAVGVVHFEIKNIIQHYIKEKKVDAYMVGLDSEEIINSEFSPVSSLQVRSCDIINDCESSVDILIIDTAHLFFNIFDVYNDWVDKLSPNGKIIFYGFESSFNGAISECGTKILIHYLEDKQYIDDIDYFEKGAIVTPGEASRKLNFEDIFAGHIGINNEVRKIASNNKNLYEMLHGIITSGPLSMHKLELLFVYFYEICITERRDEFENILCDEYGKDSEILTLLQECIKDYNHISMSRISPYNMDDNYTIMDKYQYSSEVALEEVKITVLSKIIKFIDLFLAKSLVSYKDVIGKMKSKRNVAIFGAGPSGKVCYEELSKLGIDVRLFIDNLARPNDTFLDKPVINFKYQGIQAISEIDDIILASAGRKVEMCKQLICLGVKKTIYKI